MPSQVAVASEDFAAGTVIRLDVGVGQEVSLEVGALVEAARAHGALVRGLFHVEDLVDGQRA